MSPNLIGLYLDELQQIFTDTLDNDCPMLVDYALLLLLYANNLAILSHFKDGLQHLMDALQASCQRKRLTVNVE